MMGQSRSVNQRASKSLAGSGRFQPRELHEHLLRGSQLDCSTLRQEFEQRHPAGPWSGLARFGPTTRPTNARKVVCKIYRRWTTEAFSWLSRDQGFVGTAGECRALLRAVVLGKKNEPCIVEAIDETSGIRMIAASPSPRSI
jgi:hypothetical protein